MIANDVIEDTPYMGLSGKKGFR
jgi:hypothetical protein